MLWKTAFIFINDRKEASLIKTYSKYNQFQNFVELYANNSKMIIKYPWVLQIVPVHVAYFDKNTHILFSMCGFFFQDYLHFVLIFQKD